MTPDVVVIGEVLVELSSNRPLEAASEMRLGFSGDALNAAAAAAAAGAHVALLANVADDELGARIFERVSELGIDASTLRLVAGHHGVYFVGADPDGEREFVYVRRGSAGSTLAPSDLDRVDLRTVPVTVCSGITCAISDSAAHTALAAARTTHAAGRTFIYDPNLRPRLTSAADAGAWLHRIAPFARIVTPSFPSEAMALLGATDPHGAAASLRALRTEVVAVTCGAQGVLLQWGEGEIRIHAVPPPAIVDQTGAGDAFVGALAGRLALGDDLPTSVRLGSAAAALALQGQGGTGFVATLEQMRAHLAAAPASEQVETIARTS